MVKAINPKTVEIELTDQAGVKRKFTGLIITRKNYADIITQEEEISKIKDMSRINEFMALYFGGDPADYDDYDIRALTLAVQLYTSELKNPTM